jgi:outer membrane protein assembly factor BamB
VYAFEAATGRPLWTFRVAPGKRWIPVYGKLTSTWPVAGGVVVQNGVVYAAAGIAHYDGTHVVALDAVSGKIKWTNDSSGRLSEETNSGISLQGNLMLSEGELHFLGGNVHQTARYDLHTGRCLNRPHDHVGTRFRSVFHPYYPQYGQYPSLHHTFSDGRTLECVVDHAAYQGSWHPPLRLLAPVAPGAAQPAKVAAGRRPRSKVAPKREVVWTDGSGRRFNSFVIADDVLVAAGQTGSEDDPRALLAAVNVRDGSDRWHQELPAAAVRGGTAVDHKGRVFVSLRNGRVVCFAAAE